MFKRWILEELIEIICKKGISNELFIQKKGSLEMHLLHIISINSSKIHLLNIVFFNNYSEIHLQNINCSEIHLLSINSSEIHLFNIFF